MEVIFMPKKRAHKHKAKDKKVTRTQAIAFSKSTEAPGKFRLILVLVAVIALGYWLFSTKKVEIPKIPGLEVQQTGENLVTPTPEITWESYTVKRGENLRGIALKIYGDANAWVKIAQANDIKNPDRIHPGNVLRIPR